MKVWTSHDIEISNRLVLVIRYKVYDLTGFAEIHPGGKEILCLAKGRDATILFESYHLTEISIDKFEVGIFTDEKAPSLNLSTYELPPMSQFYRTLKKRALLELQREGADSRYTCLKQIIRTLVIFLLVFGSFILSLRDFSFPVFVVLSFSAGVSRALADLHLMHDASHFCLTRFNFVNEFFGWLCCDCLNGHSFLSWRHQHVLGHHLFSNRTGVDPDISPMPIRVSPFDQHRRIHRFQHLWAPFAFSLLSYAHRYEDYAFFRYGNWDIIKARFSGFDFWLHYLGVFIFYFTQILLPLTIGYEWKKVILAHILSELLGSVYIATCFQLSHAADIKFYEKTDFKDDWAVSQVLTTQDYSVDSYLVFFLTGGLNLQTVHHLFPGVSQLHYPRLQKIVSRTCTEFAVHYQELRTVKEALTSLYQHLKEMAKPKKL